MAHTKSAKKRVRQTEARRLRNRSRMSKVRTAVKAAQGSAAEAAEKGDQADRDRAEALYRRAASELDRAARHRIIHPNAAARKKSRLAKRLLKTSATQG